MKQTIILLLFLNVFFGIDYLSTSREFEEGNTLFYASKQVENDGLEMQFSFDNKLKRPFPVLFDLSFQRASESHRQTTRRVQTNTFQFLWQFKAEIKRHYALLKNNSTTLIFIALRRAIHYPISAFSRTCDLYVFSFGHILF